jgi:predicted transposase YdaD
LFGLPVAEVELLESVQQRIEERRADLVAKVALANGETFILHIEIQNNNQAAMPVRMLRYLTDVMLDYPNTPVRQYLVYIGKKALGMADGLNLPNLAYRYELIDMHRVDSESLLQQDSPDAWILAVLCDFRDRPPREFVRGILDRLVRALHETPGRLRDYVSMLEILASNRDLNVDIQEELEMLTIEFEKLPTYRMGLKKGEEIGVEKGFRKGAHDQSVAIAERLLAKNMDVHEVASATGLAVEDVERLRAQKQSDA